MTQLPDEVLNVVRRSREGQLPNESLGSIRQTQNNLNQNTLFEQATEGASLADAAIATMQGNFMNRGRGLENSLMQLIQRTGPLDQLASPFVQMPAQPTPDFSEQIAANRQEAQQTQQLLDVIENKQPVGNFTGDAMTFLTDMMIPQGRVASGARPGFNAGISAEQRLRRRQRALDTVQEGALGAGFGAAEVGDTDDEKATIVATGLLTGAIAPNIFASVANRFRMRPETRQRIIDMMRRERDLDATGLLSFGELSAIGSFKKIENALDNMPFIGTQSFRAYQRSKMQSVANSLLRHLSRNRQGTNTDFTEMVVRRFESNKAQVDEAFGEVDRLLRNASDIGPVPPVVPTNMNQRALDLLEAEMSKVGSQQDQDVIRYLQRVIQDDPVDFNGAIKTMSSLAENTRVARTQSNRGELTKTLSGTYAQLQSAFMRDIDNWATTNASTSAKGREVMDAWTSAKRQFQDLVLPFYEAPVVRDVVASKALLRDGTFVATRVDAEDISNLVGEFISASGEKSARLMRTLSGQEQALPRYLVLREAFEKSVEDGGVNASKFAENIRRLDSAWGNVLSRDDKRLMDGFVTLARATSRSADSAGQNTLGTLVATGSVGGIVGNVGASGGAGAAAGSLAAIMGTVAGMKFFLTSPQGRSILSSAAVVGDSIARRQNLRALGRQANKAFTRWVVQQQTNNDFNADPATREALNRLRTGEIF